MELFQFDKNGIELKKNESSIAFVSRNIQGEIVIRPGQYRTTISLKNLKEILSLEKKLARRLSRKVKLK